MFWPANLRRQLPAQVGYGLVNDLHAVGRALGCMGAGCIAVVEPVIDIPVLHRSLAKHAPLGLPKACSAHIAFMISLMCIARMW